MQKLLAGVVLVVLAGAAHAQGVAPPSVGIVDGADVTQGAKADSAATSGTGGSWTVASLLRGILNGVQGTATGASPPANGNYIAGSSSGLLAGVVICDHHAFVHITSATDTMLVAHVAAKTVKVCGYKASFVGTNTVYLEQSTADACTSPSQIAGADSGLAQSVFGWLNALWGGLATTAGDALCVNSSGTGAVDVDVFYTQGS